MVENNYLRKFLYGVLDGGLIGALAGGYILSKYIFQKSFQFSNVELSTLKGDKLSLLNGDHKPMVLNFMSRGCPPCVAELPVIEKATMRYQDSVKFFCILDEPYADVKPFLDEHPYKINFVISDKDYEEYGLLGVPVTYFVDAKGVVIDSALGSMDIKRLDSLLSRLLTR